MANEENKEFDENVAIEHINNVLVSKGKKQYNEDDILLLIDAMYDYYDENDNFDSDEEIDVEEVIKYVTKVLSKDAGNTIAKEDIRDIVLAEIEYEDSLED